MIAPRRPKFIAVALALAALLFGVIAWSFWNRHIRAPEVVQILNGLGLERTDGRGFGANERIHLIEETDSAACHPRAAALWCVTPVIAPGSPRPQIRLRYWIGVEDFATPAQAQQRAAGYRVPGWYLRVDELIKARGKRSEPAEYGSVRLWAVARGRRTYLLTTDAAMFSSEPTQARLKQAIEVLPVR